MDFTAEELDLLIHFAVLGQNHVILRNHFGDREVAKELDPVLYKAAQIRFAKESNGR